MQAGLQFAVLRAVERDPYLDWRQVADTAGEDVDARDVERAVELLVRARALEVDDELSPEGHQSPPLRLTEKGKRRLRGSSPEPARPEDEPAGTEPKIRFQPQVPGSEQDSPASGP